MRIHWGESDLYYAGPTSQFHFCFSSLPLTLLLRYLFPFLHSSLSVSDDILKKCVRRYIALVCISVCCLNSSFYLGRSNGYHCSFKKTPLILDVFHFSANQWFPGFIEICTEVLINFVV